MTTAIAIFWENGEVLRVESKIIISTVRYSMYTNVLSTYTFLYFHLRHMNITTAIIDALMSLSAGSNCMPNGVSTTLAMIIMAFEMNAPQQNSRNSFSKN